MSGALLETFTPFILAAGLIVLATFLGGVLAGWTGWGGWIVAGAAVWIFFPPLVALVAAQPVILAMDTLLLLHDRQYIDRQRVRKILLWALPGTALGLLLLLLLPVHLLYALAGALLLAALLPWVWRKTPLPLASFLGGMFTTAGGWNSPPLAIGTDDLQLRARRGTLGAVFVALSLLALPLLLGISGEDFWRGIVLGAVLAPVSLLGTWMGLRSCHLPKPMLLWGICQVVVLLGACTLLVRSFS